MVDIDGRSYCGLYLESGLASVDGWLTRLAALELGLPEDELLDVRNRQLLLNGHRVDLTPKESAGLGQTLGNGTSHPTAAFELM